MFCVEEHFDLIGKFGATIGCVILMLSMVEIKH